METEVKKKNKKVVFIIIGVVAVIAVAAIIGAIFIVSNIKTPKAILEEVLTALKTNDFTKVQEYKEFMDSSELLNDSEFNQEAQKSFFDKLEWNIQEEKIEGDTATIQLEITNKDFKTAVKNYVQKVLKLAFSGEQINEEQMTNYLLEELNDENLSSVTVNSTITMKMKDGKWDIEDTNSFMNAILPGLEEAINSIT